MEDKKKKKDDKKKKDTSQKVTGCLRFSTVDAILFFFLGVNSPFFFM